MELRARRTDWQGASAGRAHARGGDVFERFRILAKTSSFLGISGKIQSESGVVHLIADELWTPNLPVKPRKRRSRDFH